MIRNRRGYRSLAMASAAAVTASLLVAGAATAQVSTSTLRGNVSDGGAAEAGATIVVRDTASGYVSRSRANTNGNYVLAGLRPGSYEVTVTTSDGQSSTETVTLGVGQVGTLDVDVASAAPAPSGEDTTTVAEIVVTARQLVEVRTPEVATNITQHQIDNLPQIDRNFLSFAALAPGMRLSESDNEKTISAGGQTAQSINVFIDGQNQKSNIIDGGVGGQDDSRGNPFPQAAVQEFRILTQNFKAEYEQASSAIIAAVTRSGTNEIEGELFVTYQNEDWISQDSFSRERGDEQPELERMQWGGFISGPIIEDRLHYFLSYERKDETRAGTVFLNQPEYESQFADELGNFALPFEQDLFFGKLSWQIDDRQRLDLSATYRTESDIRGVGGQSSYDKAGEVNTDVRSIVLQHQYQGDNFLNEMSLDYYSYVYNPTALNFEDYGRQYVIYNDADDTTPEFDFQYNSGFQNVFNTGGQSNNQDIEQESITFRNDLTFTNIEWAGFHTLKMGVKYTQHEYLVNKQLGRNPQFLYDILGRDEINGNPDIPTQVSLGSPTPVAQVENAVLGFYIQDDWQITDRLELNLGLRWDYEDNATNNDGYRTPDDIRDLLADMEALPGYDFPSYFDINDYITDGDREAYSSMFQPRIGFSYDVFGDESTVLFGGAGRYYDRIGYNFSFDELYKPTAYSRTIYFSENGGMVGGQETVAWDESYLTAEGLDPLLEAAPGLGEVFLIKNGAEPPRTDQFNLGVRQRFGEFQTAITLSYGRTENEFAWYRANMIEGTNTLGPTPQSLGYNYNGSVFISNHDRERRYRAMYITVDKPFTEESGWGMNVAYTLSESEQNGSRGDGLASFDFDYPWTDSTPWYPSSSDERHRLVASGTVAIPWDFLLSGIVTLGSGTPYTVFDCPDALSGGPPICWNGGRPDREQFLIPDAFAYRQVDLRLTKEFETWNGQRLQLIVDAINVFDFENYGGWDQGFNSPNFGNPTVQRLPTRSFQVGLRYRW